MTGRVVVVGSLNLDVIATVPRHPRPGETVLGGTLRRMLGGKGGNQAMAAARAGADVHLVACVGQDPEGEAYLASLSAAGVHTEAVRRVPDAPTGTALVVVDGRGENSIVVVPGANGHVTEHDVRAVPLHRGDVVLLQLEIPLETVAAAVQHAVASGARVVLNVAPFAELPPGLLDAADPVVVNEHEAARLLHRPASLLTTLGERGARWQWADAETSAAGPVVRVVDTTGAGDAFCGALAAALAAGADRSEAMRRAVEAAAEAVTRQGAQ